MFSNLHNDITKTLHKSVYNDYKIILAERHMRSHTPPVFLYLYVFEKSGCNSCIGDNYHDNDLHDETLWLPKIHKLIDEQIASDLAHKEAIAKHKERIGWNGRKFKRGDYVHFRGMGTLKPIDTYVWAHFMHLTLDYYIIQHPDGFERDGWLAKDGWPDGFECIHSSQLEAGLKHIEIDCHPDFIGETNLLLMRKEAD